MNFVYGLYTESPNDKYYLKPFYIGVMVKKILSDSYTELVESFELYKKTTFLGVSI